MAKTSLLPGTQMSALSNPKHWFYTSVTGIKFDSVHISIKHHPALVSLRLVISDAMENNQVKYYIVIFIVCLTLLNLISGEQRRSWCV